MSTPSDVTRRPLPEGWRWVKLGEVCHINPPRPKNFERDDNAPTSFVPMSAVDEVHGVIAQVEVKPYSQVRKGYTFFVEGDVLFAKITPCMQNGKHAIARNLIDGIGFGTTEFHVLRPRAEVLSEWIHSFIRQSWVLRDAQTHFTGSAGQQRVPELFLINLEIPLPPLSDQKRISAILREQMAAVERARKALEEQLEAINQLPAAILRKAFNGEL